MPRNTGHLRRHLGSVLRLLVCISSVQVVADAGWLLIAERHSSRAAQQLLPNLSADAWFTNLYSLPYLAPGRLGISSFLHIVPVPGDLLLLNPRSYLLALV
ncbi:hypothetical protein F4680DRAFT_416478 [Xylaria scruposa]|nr:hypothetical protein F4680DRAFT_416478 [Xylaria scruposa]